MQNLKLKLVFLLGLVLMISCLLGVSVYATNEETVIVKENEEEYLVYLKDYLNTKFEFAFSNNSEEQEKNLKFINSALDGTLDDANNIAYVDNNTINLFKNTTYMWIRKDGNIEVTAREIDLNDNIVKANLQGIGSISKVIPIKLEQKVIENTTSENGLKKTTTVGIVKFINEYSNLQYQLVKRPAEGETNDFFALAELIEKNDFTDMYTKIKASKKFVELCGQQLNSLSAENWKDVEENTILQPEDTENGDQYILWLKSDNTADVHFLTSYRKEDEEWVKEQIKTILPDTYDNNFVIIALGVVIICIIAVTIRIVILKRKKLRK